MNIPSSYPFLVARLENIKEDENTVRCYEIKEGDIISINQCYILDVIKCLDDFNLEIHKKDNSELQILFKEKKALYNNIYLMNITKF